MKRIDWSALIALAGLNNVPLWAFVERAKQAGADTRLYRGSPGRWIAHGLDGVLYEFGADAGGWERRRPYATGLPVDGAVDALSAIGTGWPIVDAFAMAREIPS